MHGQHNGPTRPPAVIHMRIYTHVHMRAPPGKDRQKPPSAHTCTHTHAHTHIHTHASRHPGGDRQIPPSAHTLLLIESRFLSTPLSWLPCASSSLSVSAPICLLSSAMAFMRRVVSNDSSVMSLTCVHATPRHAHVQTRVHRMCTRTPTPTPTHTHTHAHAHAPTQSHQISYILKMKTEL